MQVSTSFVLLALIGGKGSLAVAGELASARACRANWSVCSAGRRASPHRRRVETYVAGLNAPPRTADTARRRCPRALPSWPPGKASRRHPRGLNETAAPDGSIDRFIEHDFATPR